MYYDADWAAVQSHLDVYSQPPIPIPWNGLLDGDQMAYVWADTYAGLGTLDDAIATLLAN
jgi:hypothetical protein